MTFWESVKKLYTSKNTDRDIYPFTLTKFSIDDFKRGCNDVWLSGNHSGRCLGDCCIFCIPVTIAIDIALCVPFGLYCMCSMCVERMRKNKDKIKIQTVSPSRVKIQIQEEAYIQVQPKN